MPTTFEQIRRLTRGFKTDVWIEMREATAMMQKRVADAVRYNTTVQRPRKFPIEYHAVWDHGDLNVDAHVVFLYSDDLFFPDPTIKEIRKVLHNLEHDQYQIRRLFCWDQFHVVNAGIPPQWMTFMMVNTNGFPKIHRMSEPALDVGFLTEEDRDFKALSYPETTKLLNHPEELIEVISGDSTTQSDRP